jgi:hypothetical protein
MAFTPRKVSIARNVISPRLPMGVLTRCKRPGGASLTDVQLRDAGAKTTTA